MTVYYFIIIYINSLCSNNIVNIILYWLASRKKTSNLMFLSCTYVTDSYIFKVQNLYLLDIYYNEIRMLFYLQTNIVPIIIYIIFVFSLFIHV